jgi:hypothetical protein
MPGATDQPQEVSKSPSPDGPLVKKEEDVDFSSLFEYLKSPQGHDIASRIVGLVEGLKKATLDRTADLSVKQLDAAQVHRKNTHLLQAGAMLMIVAASTILVLYSKFDTSVGVLFGSIMGYIFGKRAGSDL